MFFAGQGTRFQRPAKLHTAAHTPKHGPVCRIAACRSGHRCPPSWNPPISFVPSLVLGWRPHAFHPRLSFPLWTFAANPCYDKHYNGRFGEWKARQLKELAGDSFGIPDCEGAYSALLLMYLDQLQSLQNAAAALEKRIASLFSQFNSTLTSITGVGPVLGAVILSEIRDISCFASAD